MTLNYTPISFLFNGPLLHGDEEIVASCVAQHVQRGIARGGMLFLSNKRLIFLPNRAEALIGGCPWSADLPNVAKIGRDRPSLSLFGLANGGWHERLLIKMVTGTTEYFVISDLGRIEAQLQHYIFATSVSLEATRRTSGTSQLHSYIANMTFMHFLTVMLCLVVATVVFKDDIRDTTWVMTFPLYVSPFMLAPALRDLFVFNPRITIHVTTVVALFSIIAGLVLQQIRPSAPTPLPLQELSMLVAMGLGSYLSVHLVLRSDSRSLLTHRNERRETGKTTGTG